MSEYNADTPMGYFLPAATSPNYDDVGTSNEPLSGLLRAISEHRDFCPTDGAQRALSPVTGNWPGNFYRGY